MSEVTEDEPEEESSVSTQLHNCKIRKNLCIRKVLQFCNTA